MNYRSPLHQSQVNLNDPRLRGNLIRNGGLSFGAMFWPFLAILGFAIIQALRFGVARTDYGLLIVGSIVSITAGALYYVDIRMAAEGTNKWALSSWIGPIGILTYLFIVYLFFYRGLWSLSLLINNFSYRPILRMIVFVGLSSYALKQFHRLTEIERTLKRRALS